MPRWSGSSEFAQPEGRKAVVCTILGKHYASLCILDTYVPIKDHAFPFLEGIAFFWRVLLHCQQRLTQVLHLGKHSDRVEPNAQHSRQCHCNPIEEDTSRLVVPSETNNVWQGGIMLILFYHGVQVCQQALNVSPQWNSVNLEFFPIISQKEQTKAAISCPLGCHVA